jgi:hypothetical protein
MSSHKVAAPARSIIRLHRSLSPPTQHGRNFRRTIINLAVAASVVTPLALVGTAPSASAYDGQRPVPCEGFYGAGGPLCFVSGAADGDTWGDAEVYSNPDNEWVFILHCAWGGDQMSGANPPSWDEVHSHLQCNLGAPATGAEIRAT